MWNPDSIFVVSMIVFLVVALYLLTLVPDGFWSNNGFSGVTFKIGA